MVIVITYIFSITLRKLRNNALNNTLDMGDNICPQLQLVDLQDNQISSVTIRSQYKNTLM